MASIKTTTKDMTSGSIFKHLLLFSLPLMLGNIFQMLYNTVDSIVVGNFVGTQALAAVGSTTMIINMLVFFFNGFSIGAGVVVGQNFGARNKEALHTAIETTMATTFVLSVLFSVLGVAAVPAALRFMSTPEDVLPEATLYLRIYIGGISGLLVYNIGSGILRAVGDTTRPLYFLVLTSVLNILLDLLLVIVFHLGIAGVAIATIVSQFVSAGLILLMLTKTTDIYRLSWSELRIDPAALKKILMIGLPAGVQAVLTSFSNIFVQSYINRFGSSCMAGWSSYNKLDTFAVLPMQSFAMASTTFVSQNIGAQKTERADRGTRVTLLMTIGITGTMVLLLYAFARPAVGLFTSDPAVLDYGALFIRTNSLFLVFNSFTHVLAGSLRGRGDSRGPMMILLLGFVGIRQTYLYLVTHFIANTEVLVALGYPVGWVSCAVIEAVYYLVKKKKWKQA